ncbi:MAG: response regulator [Gammaproteobacteria bacterium]|nr:response regulator [Gammaproteobacteria bacterium]
MNIRLRSVRHKLLLVVLVTNFCALVAAGGALLYHDLMEDRNKMAGVLTTMANILGQGSATALEFDDPRVANESLALLRADPNIITAAIYTARGTLFAQYVRDQEHKTDIPIAPAREGFHFGTGELTMFKRITKAGVVLGTVYLKQGYDLSQWMGDYLIILGAVLLASLAIGAAVLSRLQRWISGPIEAISRVALQVMQQRNYHLRADKSTQDEIGQLADAFNGMLHTLEHEIAERSAAEHEVRTLNAELEQRVTERTTELQIANQTLLARTGEAEAANRAKADFLANMSHEIRTPMNGILGLAYLLDQKHLDADASELVKKIRNAGRSLQAIINDILDFSKIEAGRMEIEHATFALTDVLDNLASIMGANAGDKDLELIIAPPPSVGGQLLGDALRLEQILINLTGNAIKFTDHGMVRVAINLLARDDKTATLRFSVRDTGIGIPLEKQAQIFSAFSQADTSTTRRFGGTGLGLTISRHLVTRMGGEIGVISEPGRGSEFWFTIPFEWIAATEYAPVGLARLNILVADDSEIARENLALTALSIGWTPSKVESGLAAIQAVRTKVENNRLAYDVLLLDWKMPEMDGLATAKVIRSSFKTESSPIVLMVTAFSRDEMLKQPDIDLVDGVLSKPVTSSNLYNCVAEVLRRRGHAHNVASQLAYTNKRIPGVRVLVVDDSDINREVAQRILQADGALVTLANDGKAAIDWLYANPQAIDVVLMDVQMPVMDGYEATREIRKSAQFANLPVVALTAGAFKAQQNAAQLAGMNTFVAKPFNVEELMEAIQRLTHCKPEPVLIDNSVGTANVKGNRLVFTNLPGIAITKALQVWKDINDYQNFLNKFAVDYADCTAEIRAFQAENNQLAAQALAHKLKGAAGNLALTEVAQFASEIEAITVIAGDASEPLGRLQTALNTVFTSIARFNLTQDVQSAPQLIATDPARAAPLLEELLHALDRDNPDKVKPLLDALAQMVSTVDLTSLHACVDDFDFRGAETLTRRLISSLRINPKE